MILLLVVVCFGVLLSLLYGWILEFVAVKFLKLSEEHDIHFSITVLLGMALLSGLLGIWSFFLGVDVRAIVFYLLMAILALVGIRKYVLVRLNIIYGQLKSFGVLSWLLILLISIYGFYRAAVAPPVYDAGLYYLQTIRWMESYRVVPGLANLHVRLGFNSNIFLLAAFFGFADLGWHLYQVPGLMIFLLTTQYCLNLIQRSGRVLVISTIVALGVIVFLLFAQSIYWMEFPLTSDLPAAIMCWCIFLLLIEKIETGRIEQFDLRAMALIVLSFFDVTIKLSLTPILLIPLYLLWKTRTSLMQSFSIILLPSAVFLPWIARNVVLTGYPIFPFAQLDVFRLNWKVPSLLVRRLTINIVGYARDPNNSKFPRQIILASMPLHEWLPIWYQTLNKFDRHLLVSIIAGIVLFIVLITLNKRLRKQAQIYSSIYVVSIVGTVFWFAQAPAPRFGYGFLVALLLFLYTPLVIQLLELLRFPSKWLVLIIQFLLTVAVLTNIAQFPLSSWKPYISLIQPYPKSEVKSWMIGNQNVFQPRAGADQCWYNAFPCTKAIVSENLRMRGPTLEDGFYILQK